MSYVKQNIPKIFLENAIEAADILQGYVDLLIDKLEDLSDHDREELGKLVAARVASGSPLSSSGAEEAGAIGILDHILNVYEDEGDDDEPE